MLINTSINKENVKSLKRTELFIEFKSLYFITQNHSLSMNEWKLFYIL